MVDVLSVTNILEEAGSIGELVAWEFDKGMVEVVQLGHTVDVIVVVIDVVVIDVWGELVEVRDEELTWSSISIVVHALQVVDVIVEVIFIVDILCPETIFKLANENKSKFDNCIV